MFDDLRKYLDDIEKNDIESTKEFLNKLNGARRRLNNSIQKSEEEIKSMKNETRYVASLKPQISKDALKLAKDSLFNAVQSALRTNKEFDDPLYRVPLFEAVESDNTYLVRINGSGFNSKISIDIDLNRSAGTLNMWSAAVKAARKKLKVHVPRIGSKGYERAAQSASQAWARHYANKDEKYTTMIETRLSLSAKSAPFWSILNFGTVPLTSDRGGFPTPTNKVTNFINEAETNAKSAVLGLFDVARENFNNLFENYNKYLDDAYQRQERLDSLADKVRLDRSIVRQLERELNLDKNVIDRNELEKAVDQVRKGLLTQGRVNIGSGKRKTLSVNVIKEFLTQYG